MIIIKKTRLLTFIGVLLIVIGISISYIGIKKIYEIKMYKIEDNKLANEIVKKDKKIESKEDYIYIKIDFDLLRNRNSDIKYWLFLPDTNINQPILKEQNEGEFYYLNHDMDKNYKVEGSLFMPKVSDEEDKAYQIIFGHMMTKSVYGDYMFSMLRDYYIDEKVAMDKYRKIYLYGDEKTYEFEVVGANETLDDDSIYLYPKKLGSIEYGTMLENIKNTANWISTDVNEVEETLILSTCNGGINTRKRFFVIFKLERVYDIKNDSVIKY